MRNRFCDGFFEGLALMFAILIFALVITITFAPFILVVMHSNALWLLLYFIIVPIDCGLWNVIF